MINYRAYQTGTLNEIEYGVVAGSSRDRHLNSLSSLDAAVRSRWLRRLGDALSRPRRSARLGRQPHPRYPLSLKTDNFGFGAQKIQS
jgi:hypothetical protein